MEQAINNIPSLSPLTKIVMYNSDLTAAEEKIKKHEFLLYKIATSFGFNETDSWALVQQVCVQAYKQYLNHKICFPLKVWLVKDLVHKCVFSISCKQFSRQNMDAPERKWNVLNEASAYTSPGGSYLPKMPLSYSAVYLLCIMFRFNVIEVAEILNITPYKVKERLKKAFTFIKDASDCPD